MHNQQLAIVATSSEFGRDFNLIASFVLNQYLKPNPNVKRNLDLNPNPNPNRERSKSESEYCLEFG